MKARAPGKLILSGEHSAVYGRPALVMALKRYAHAEVTPTDDDFIHLSFPGGFSDDQFPVAALPGLKQRLQRNYHAFLTGSMDIQHVLSSPAELIYYALIHLLEHEGRELEHGWRVALTTDLPVGSGMGASAAISVAVLGAAAATWDIAMDKEKLYRLALDVEKLQHGHPSGVDPFVSVNGGCLRFQEGEATVLPEIRTPMYLVLTGAPASSTGECVSTVARQFPKDDPVWRAFEHVTADLEKAFETNDRESILAGVHANHRLLTRIGVVPDRVGKFIEQVEKSGDAAKICGAGAVRGIHGGVVAVFSRTPPDKLCKDFDYELAPVELEPHGFMIEG
jgi:mevalonate kinase